MNDHEVKIRLLVSPEGHTIPVEDATPSISYSCPCCATKLIYTRAHSRNLGHRTAQVTGFFSHGSVAHCSGESAEHYAAKHLVAETVHSPGFNGFWIAYDNTAPDVTMRKMLDVLPQPIAFPSAAVSLRIYSGKTEPPTAAGTVSMHQAVGLSFPMTATGGSSLFSLVGDKGVKAVTEYRTTFNTIADVGVLDANDNLVLVVEIFKTHRLTEENMNKYIALGIPVIEVSVESMIEFLRLSRLSSGTHYPNPNTLYPIAASIVGPPISDKNVEDFRILERNLAIGRVESQTVKVAIAPHFAPFASCLLPNSVVRADGSESELLVRDLVALSRSFNMPMPVLDEIFSGHGLKPSQSEIRPTSLTSFNETFRIAGVDLDLERLVIDGLRTSINGEKTNSLARTNDYWAAAENQRRIVHDDRLRKLEIERLARVEADAAFVRNEKLRVEQRRDARRSVVETFSYPASSADMPSGEEDSDDDEKGRLSDVVKDQIIQKKYQMLVEARMKEFGESGMVHPPLAPSDHPRNASLDDDQKTVSNHGQGPLAVEATAGAGKTRAIVHGTANLLADGTVKPWNVLAISFTKKAQGELAGRIRSFIPQGGDQVMVRTFHSVAIHFLKSGPHAARLGYHDRNFAIGPSYLRTTVNRYVNAMYERLFAPPKSKEEAKARRKRIMSDQKHLLGQISDAKAYGLYPSADDRPFLSMFMTDDDIEAYASISSMMVAGNIMDYDDVVMNFNRLMRHDRNFAEAVWSKIHYIKVDEYQDCNLPQVEMAMRIAGHRANITAVGDEDQAIYGWRGAAPENFRRFREMYPSAKIHSLAKNYRCSGHVVHAMSAVITHNQSRLAKIPVPNRAPGDKIRVLHFGDNLIHDDFIVAQVRKDLKITRPSEVAILSRNKRGYQSLLSALRNAGIPYSMPDNDLFAGKDIKNLIHYIRFLSSVDSMESLREIINYPARGIGEVAQDKLLSSAVIGDNLLELLRRGAASAKASNGLTSFVASLDRLVEMTTAGSSPSSIVRTIIREFRLDKVTEGPASEIKLKAQKRRDESLSDFLDIVEGFRLQFPAGSLSELVDYLEDFELRSQKDAVNVMTVHKSKGLEFTSVYLAGANMYYESPKATSVEERNIFFVAGTRAIDHLTICSFAGDPRSYGEGRPILPTPFIGELPADDIEIDDRRPYLRRRGA